MTGRPRSTALIVLVVVGSFAQSAVAQSTERPWQVSVAAGPMSWDASGTGDTYAAAARAARDIKTRWLGVELGGTIAGLDEQFSGATTRVLAVDAQLQLQTPTYRVQPYLAAGPSLFTYLTQARGRDLVEPGYTVGAGIRARVTPRLGFVLDARVRGWDFEQATDFTVNVSGEAMLGLLYRF
jgi:hypothetical protein